MTNSRILQGGAVIKHYSVFYGNNLQEQKIIFTITKTKITLLMNSKDIQDLS